MFQTSQLAPYAPLLSKQIPHLWELSEITYKGIPSKVVLNDGPLQFSVEITCQV